MFARPSGLKSRGGGMVKLPAGQTMYSVGKESKLKLRLAWSVQMKRGGASAPKVARLPNGVISFQDNFIFAIIYNK